MLLHSLTHKGNLSILSPTKSDFFIYTANLPFWVGFLFSKIDHRRYKYMNVMKTGKPFFADDIVPDPKFGNRHLALRAFRVGNGLGIITTDITERKETEEKLEDMVEKRTKELRDAQEELIRKEKLATLGQLVGGVSHELRNPLGAHQERRLLSQHGHRGARAGG